METGLVKNMGWNSRENRFVFDGPVTPVVAPVEAPNVDPEFEKFKSADFKGSDGSTWNHIDGMYTPPSGSPMVAAKKSAEEVFVLKKALDKADADKKAAEVKKATDQTEVVTDSKQQKIEFKTGVELDALKNAMGEKFKDFTEVLKAILKDYQGLKGEFNLEKNFDSGKYCGEAERTMRTSLMALFIEPSRAGQIGRLLEHIQPFVQNTITSKDVSEILATMYASSAKTSLKAKFDDIRLEEFSKHPTFDKSYVDKPCTMQYKISLDTGTLRADITPVEAEKAAFTAAHDEFKKNTLLAADPKAVEERQKVDQERMKRARTFRSSIQGKILGWFGIIEVGEGPEGETPEQAAKREDEAYASVLRGEQGLAKWFIHLLGGGAMIDGGTADIQESIAGMDPRLGVIVANFEKTAGNLPLNLKKTAEQLKSPIQAAEAAVEDVDKEKFGEMLVNKADDKSKILEKPFKLKEACDAGAKGLQVVLKDGAEMILPPKGSVMIAGKAERADDDKVRTFKETVTITGNIPEGTEFKGKVQFVRVSDDNQDKAAA